MVIAGLLSSYFSYYVNPSQYWFVSISGLFYFGWVILNFLFVIIWLFVKWKYSLFSFITILAGIFYHSKMIGTEKGQSNPANINSISVMSYNIQLFKYYDWKRNETLRDQLISFIAKNPADVYCFQEYFQTRNHEFLTTEKLQEVLDDYEMYFKASVIKYNNQEFGLATFSKLPIIRSDYILIDSNHSRTNLIVYNDILLRGDTVRIYNVHLASNHLNTNEVDSMMNNSGKSIFFAKKWLKKLKNGYKRRYYQVNILAEYLNNSPYPTIVAGDFNDVPLSYTYRQMSKKYTDSFLESGSGIGVTYNGNLPMLRIDYIFHSSEFTCNQFRVHHQSTTDHYPITAKLTLGK